MWKDLKETNHHSYQIENKDIKRKDGIKLRGSVVNINSALTQLRGGLHQAPGLTSPLANDQVQNIWFQAILQDLMEGRAQVL